MNWHKLLTEEFDRAYKAAEGLMALVEDATLGWKPATGANWMTVGQLIKHVSEACGGPVKGFATGDWGLPPGMDMKDMTMEDMLPPAEKMPAVQSVAEARKLLAEDKKTAYEILAQCDEARLDTEPAPAPWDPSPVVLGYRLLQMAQHLNAHKSQLFYYLKLQGQPVNTGHLWGM